MKLDKTGRYRKFYSWKMISVSFLLLSICSSCEKVIDIDLNSADKKYVIEAVITDKAGTAKVQITQTKNFNDDNNFPGVSGAKVSITESGGPTTVLNETSAGTYEAPLLFGTSGLSYSLSVQIGPDVFTAVCNMPQKINLDTIYVTDELLFTETRKIVNAEYQDPPGKGNNYRFIQYVNTYREDQIIIENDDYTDGRKVTDKLFYFTEDENDVHNIHSGDQVRIEMLCIDPSIYKYWYSLDRSATGVSGQATPANPVTNLQGGALGYFSAQTVQIKTMIVP